MSGGGRDVWRGSRCVEGVAMSGGGRDEWRGRDAWRGSR